MSLSEVDSLLPYKTHHGPVHRRNRDTQQCQHRRYGNTTYSLVTAHVNQSDFDHVVDIHHKLAQIGDYYWRKRNIVLRFQRVYNPERTFSVLEPGYRGSCEDNSGTRALVEETARASHCVVAANAGFFNTHTGQCLGNIVSDGRLVQDSGGIQNVHFGITKQGKLFTGYLSEIELVTLQFRQLVGGVVWLIRDGQVYVDESRDIECPDTEETGTLDRFIGVVSARTAVGHDAEGRVLMVQVDGKTDQQGVDLYELASLLKELGFVNAINLDGGGSATSVLHGNLVSYPSDTCFNGTWNCARAVSTILCVHQPDCSLYADCSFHGECVSGHCWCHSPWTGDSCDVLSCPSDCSGHGQCLEEGCVCGAGWKGRDCSAQCDEGTHGLNCSGVCHCLNNSTCHPQSGQCQCAAGFTGTHCEDVCGYGWFGEGCRERCFCPEDCFCDPISGACSSTWHNEDFIRGSQCLLAAAVREKKLVPDQSGQLRVWKWTTLVTGVFATISLGINVALAVVVYTLLKRVKKKKRSTHAFRHFKHNSPSKVEVTELLPLRRGEEDDPLVDYSDEDMTETLALRQVPGTGD